MARDYYKILGVGRDATNEEIKKAFRSIARSTHPDANPGDPGAEARFRDAAEAYEVLSDPDRRRRYDRGDAIDISDLFSGFGSFDDLLRSVFGEGSMFGYGPAPRPARGGDVLVRAEVDLAGAAFGTDAEITFRTRKTCEVCSGSGAEEGGGQTTCPNCQGAGSVRTARRSLFGTMMTVPRRRCDHHAPMPGLFGFRGCRGRGHDDGRGPSWGLIRDEASPFGSWGVRRASWAARRPVRGGTSDAGPEIRTSRRRSGPPGFDWHRRGNSRNQGARTVDRGW
jgi:curved DNA-binding protein CbpA